MPKKQPETPLKPSKPRAKIGRPTDDPKEVILQARLGSEDLARLNALLEKTGLTRTELVRDMIKREHARRRLG